MTAQICVQIFVVSGVLCSPEFFTYLNTFWEGLHEMVRISEDVL